MFRLRTRGRYPISGTADSSTTMRKAMTLISACLAALTVMLALFVPGQCAFAAEDNDLVAGEIAGGTAFADDAATADKGLGAILGGATAKSGKSSGKDAELLSETASDDEVGTNATSPEFSFPYPIVPGPGTWAFIDLIGEDARTIAADHGLYASVMIAQAILESGSGSSGLSQPPLNNLFGIKGSYHGKSVYLPTSEDDGTGEKYDIMAHFRRYPSIKESLLDYADLLTRSMGGFYAPVWKTNAPTYVQACNYLQGHYATDTTYSSKLQGLIIAYDLTRYDHPADAAGQREASQERAKLLLMAVGAGQSVPGITPVAVAGDDVDESAASTDAATYGQASTTSEQRIDIPPAAVIVPTVSTLLASLFAGLLANELCRAHVLAAMRRLLGLVSKGA